MDERSLQAVHVARLSRMQVQIVRVWSGAQRTASSLFLFILRFNKAEPTLGKENR